MKICFTFYGKFCHSWGSSVWNNGVNPELKIGRAELSNGLICNKLQDQDPLNEAPPQAFFPNMLNKR